MMINAFFPTLGLMAGVLILRPCKRWRKAPSAVTQRDLDQLYEGAEFDPGSRIPYILTTLFTCLLYSGGMPLMLPIACVTLTLTYWAEKWLILRHYRIPPAYDHSLPTAAVRATPYALALHLTFSIWAYGNPDLYVSVRSDQPGLGPAGACLAPDPAATLHARTCSTPPGSGRRRVSTRRQSTQTTASGRSKVGCGGTSHQRGGDSCVPRPYSPRSAQRAIWTLLASPSAWFETTCSRLSSSSSAFRSSSSATSSTGW